jgi:hypothetical protein
MTATPSTGAAGAVVRHRDRPVDGARPNRRVFKARDILRRHKRRGINSHRFALTSKTSSFRVGVDAADKSVCGAVGAALRIDDTSLCFVNFYLPTRLKSVAERNKQLRETIANLSFVNSEIDLLNQVCQRAKR